MEALIFATVGLIAIPVLRQAIKSYRAKKAIADILVDSIEAAVDTVEKKKWHSQTSLPSILPALASSALLVGS